MEMKTAGFGLAGIVIAVFGVIIMFAVRHESQKSELAILSTELAGKEEALEKVQKALAVHKAERVRLEREKAEAVSESGTLQTLKSEVDGLRGELKSLGDEWDRVTGEFDSVVRRVRQTAKKAPPADIKLPSGQVLKNATITDIGAGVITVQHSDGIRKLKVIETPQEMSERFALQWQPEKLDTGEEKSASRVAAVAGDAAPPPRVSKPETPQPATPATPAAAPVESANAPRAAELKKKIADLNVKIVQATNAATAADAEAAKHWQQYRLTQLKGGTGSSKPKAEEAEKRARELRADAASGKALVSQLEAELRGLE